MKFLSTILLAIVLATDFSGCKKANETEDTCHDGVRNQIETGVDCGGPCGPCPTCSDGIKNGNEIGVDCGGACPHCITCSDGIQNQGETGVDCGGPCGLCPTCSDGIKNGTETGIDCGGSCTPCPTCSDGIKNGNETGVDCGGTCNPCPTCSDGIKNGNETGVDCGGTCTPCITCSDGIQNQGETGIDCGGPCPACFLGNYLVSGSSVTISGPNTYTNPLGPYTMVVTSLGGSAINLVFPNENQDYSYVSSTATTSYYTYTSGNSDQGGCTFYTSNDSVSLSWGNTSGGVHAHVSDLHGIKIP